MSTSFADNVPDGISAKDHAAGLASSLMNLAEHLEGSWKTCSPWAFAMHSRAARGDGFWGQVRGVPGGLGSSRGRVLQDR